MPITKLPDSASIEGFAYDEAKRTLELHFKNGGHYSYADVPPGIPIGLQGAKSAGNYFRAHISRKFEHTNMKPKKVATA